MVLKRASRVPGFIKRAAGMPITIINKITRVISVLLSIYLMLLLYSAATVLHYYKRYIIER